MTKNNKKTTPTNVEQLTAVLKWRLAKAPTKEDITELLDLGIIDKGEAKQLLFNEVKDSATEREEALKEQIKFLEGVVEKLANNRNGWGWINTYTYTPNYPTKHWVTYSSGGLTGGNTIYAMSANNAVSLSSNVIGGSTGIAKGTITGSSTGSNTVHLT